MEKVLLTTSSNYEVKLMCIILIKIRVFNVFIEVGSKYAASHHFF
jgi:hypothetical protein